MRQLGGTDLKRLHRSWARRTQGRLGLVLDGVQSPFNVGAVVRTAAALRVETIYLTASSTSPSHPRSRRLSMGTERYVGLEAVESGVEGVRLAREAGFEVIALELTDDALPLHEMDLAGDICLVIGHEDHGVGRETLTAAGRAGYLPQLGRVGSLNVATATALALYEVRRQEWT